MPAAPAGTPPAAGGGSSWGARPRLEYPALHVIKAAAIVAVLVNHAGPFGGGPDRPALDRWLRTGWLDFHVPAFVFVSGFLYHSVAPIPWRGVARRLARIVPPYLVASLLGIALGIFQPKDGIAFALATGSANGIYYYVFVMALLIPLLWPMSRVPRRAVELGLGLLLLHLVLASFWRPLLPVQDWFWGLRNPLMLAPFFFAGWLARAHLPALSALARRHGGLALAACLAVGALYAGFHGSLPGGGTHRLARFAYTLAVIGAIAIAWSGRAVPRPLRALADATLTLYLYHILVYQGLHFLGHVPPWPRIPTLVTLGLAAGLSVAYAGRALFGRASRFVTGT